MNITLATEILSPQNLATTAITLSALDHLQGHFYRELIEPEVRKEHRFSESDVEESISRTLHGMTVKSLLINGYGTNVSFSMFLNNLSSIGLEEPAQLAFASWNEFETENQ
jgi:hypothetical protein